MIVPANIRVDRTNNFIPESIGISIFLDRGEPHNLSPNNFGQSCFKLHEAQIEDVLMISGRRMLKPGDRAYEAGFCEHAYLRPIQQMLSDEYITHVTTRENWDDCDLLPNVGAEPLFLSRLDLIDDYELHFLHVTVQAIFPHLDPNEKLACASIIDHLPTLKSIKDLHDLDEIVILENLMILLDSRETAFEPAKGSFLDWSIAPLNSMEYWCARSALKFRKDKLIFIRDSIPQY